MFFVFNDTATTEIYTLSLHDALPISEDRVVFMPGIGVDTETVSPQHVSDSQVEAIRRELGLSDADTAFCMVAMFEDRKSTRLNSSHANISYAVFCLKKKKLHVCYLFF